MATQVNRRRTALAEIPVRMSQLRVSTDEVPVLMNRTVIDSPLDNIPIGYLTPSPSQDECKYLNYNHIHEIRLRNKSNHSFAIQLQW